MTGSEEKEQVHSLMKPLHHVYQAQLGSPERQRDAVI